MLANWDFDTFSTDGVVIDAVSGNNLTLLHVSGAGFSASTPALSLEVQENAANGTLVGSVTGVDAERDAEIAALLAADTDLRYSAETNKFYKVFTTGMNFSVAQANAGAALLNGEGGQLVTIRSAHEQNLIENYISGHSGEFYIGATDATTEGQWNWIDGGVEADRFWNGDATGSAPGGVYENWHADEPQGGAGENYAAIRQSDGIWLDNSGLGLKGSIVEWNADDVLDQTQPLTYDIQSQTVAGAFAIDADSGEITVADGSLIDFSANPIHSLTLRVADTSGNFYDEVFTINVESAPVTAVDNAYSLDEDATLTVDWWNTDWTRRQLLTFDNSGQTENLTDFAVLVKLNSTNIDYAQTQNGGQDLRFLDADGTALAHEIEQWNEAGDSYVWVKVPQIDGASATDHIQMYYGNATADDAQTSTEVWDGNYRGVWHLDETAVDEGSGAIHDDSAGDFDGVQDGNASALGQIGGGQEFDGLDDLIDLGTTTIIDGRSAFTISAWVKVDASPGTFDMYGVYSRIPSPTEEGTLNFNVGQWGPDDLHYLVPTNDGAWHDHVSDSEISVGTWANIVAAYDGAGMIRYYLNGNPDGSDSYTTPSDIAGLAQRIGMEKAGAAFDGVIDEVRVSDTERSADWIKAQHLSMPDSFVSFGGAQSAPLVDGVVATDLHNGNNTLTAILVSGPSQAAAFTFNADGTFSYTPNPGYHGSDSFTYKINDGSQDSNVATVDITVASVADAPVIGGVDSGSVTEDVGVVAGNLVASGSLTITDEDTGESSFQAETINGSYGDLTIDTAGNWSYSADNAQPAIQSLNTGESLVETLAVTTFDGSTHDVVITINGADEPNSTPELLSGELISNGNFDTDLSGWATAGTATWGPDGELRFGEFNDVGPHSASQTINTVAGETYRLIFDYRDDKTIFDQTLQVTVDGISQLLDSGNIVTDVLGETHVRYEYIFVADSATATVTFTDVSDIAGVSQGTIGVDGLIDNVSVRQINGPIGTASFTEDGPAVVLDAGISVFDPELSTQDNFDGATLTLERNGGANADDVFSATGTLGTLTQGGNIVVGATTIGSVTTNSAGTLQLSFNSSATNTLVNSALQQITYSNPNNTPPANVLLDWTFSDGNSGAQGSGGALQVIASTTVNITPANDAPAIGGDDSGTVIEDVAVVAGDINASGSLTVVDPDAGESSFQAETVNGSYGDLTIDTAGNWSCSADNSQLAIQALDAGESLAEVLTVTTFDGSTHNVTITINGAEDAPVIGGVAIGAVTEDGSLTATDTLTITDADTSDNPVSFNDVVATLGDNGYGNFEITSNTWTYTLNNSHAAVQALDAGESLNDTYTFTATDGSTRIVTVTINGAEDAAVVGGTAVGTVTEDGSLTATDTLTITDADTSDNPVGFNDVAATLGDNGYGNFEITSNTWTYTLNNSLAAVQALDAGETLNDTYTFAATDGSTQVVTVTINGAEDAPVIGGVATGAVTEDGSLIATDTLTITDADTSDNPVSFNDVAATLGDNGYGNFEITSNTWTYTLNNSHAAVQALDAGESLNDTYTFTATDGSTRIVTVTINGAEDAAVIGGTAVGTVTEDGTLTATDTLTITDTDTSDNPVGFNDVAATLGDNGYGNFEITSNTWTYTLNNSLAAVQALDAGETLNDTYTFAATDGSTQVVTVTINGAEDAAVIGGVATGAVTEDGTLTASDTLTITDADTSDNPVSFNDMLATTGDNGYGNFEMTANVWTYTLNNGSGVVQALDAGETLVDTFTFTATDGSTRVVTVTVNGAEDAPTLDNPLANQSATEDVAFGFTFPVNTFGDLDATDNLIYSATLSDDSPLPAWLSFDAATRTFSGTPLNADVGSIDIKITADDGSSTVTDSFTLTVNNSSDAPVIGGVDSAAVTEDNAVVAGNISAGGNMTIADPDLGESSFIAATVSGSYGDLIIDTAGNWSYSADNSQISIQALDAGETLIETLTVTTFDGSSHDVIVTIYGAEDAPVIGGTVSGSVAEDGSLTVGAALTITDTDSSDNPLSFVDVAATPGDNGYGNFELTSNSWTFTLNNSHAAVQGLDVGETLTDSYTFTASDGSTQTVTVTIDGAEDLPVLGGVSGGAVGEDGTLVASATLTIADTDTSDNPIGYNDLAPTPGSNGFGSFEISGNTWTYTLNNGHAAVQGLDVGESLSDSFTFNATDGSTQLVTVTIDGAEDAPTVDNAIADQTATEDVVFNFSFAANSFGDLDSSDSLAYSATLADDSPLPAWLNFDAATRSFSGTPSNADVGSIDVKITADDGSSTISDSFTLTVNNSADPAVIAGVDTGAVTEDIGVIGGEISTTGSLTIADPDAGESSFQAATVSGTYGALTIDTAGNWIYSAANSQAALQALDAGESLLDTLTVAAFDGTTHDVTITLNGAEDAPVIGGVATGAVAEDGTLLASDTLTIADTDSSDNPVGFNDVAATPGDNGYGNFEITSNTWSYTLNNAHAAVQALDVGESLSDSYTFVASDGSNRTVTVTIAGSEDLPVLGGVTSGVVVEDGALTATGGLTISDADSSDNPVSYNDVTLTQGVKGYGNFEITGNTWTYTLNNSHAAVQGLDAGETLSDSFTFTASDGSTQLVSLIINGAEDAPTLDNSIPDQSAMASLVFNYTFAANSFGDLDASDTLSYSATLSDGSPLPVWLGFDGATRSFTGTPAAGDVGVIDIKVTADDGSSTVTDNFSLTVVAFNNLPLIAGVDQATLIEDQNAIGGQLSAAGALSITDPDIGESSFMAATVNGALGTLSIDTAGNWAYSADNSQAAIQSLQSGESLVDVLTITTADGSTHDVVVTIHGVQEPVTQPVDDPPVVDPAPEPEPPPEQEAKPESEDAIENPILGQVTPMPQETAAPPQTRGEDVAGFLRQDQPATPPAGPKPELARPAAASQLQPIAGQTLNLDQLKLQVSDDAELNQLFELELLERIDRMHQGIDGDGVHKSVDDIQVQIFMGSTASITAGIVSWVLRGGSLLASLMGTVPLLNRFDPLPILKTREEDEARQPDDDSDSAAKQRARRVDKMFAGQSKQQPGSGSLNE